MQRTYQTSRKLAPFFDPETAQEGEGGQIEWSRHGRAFYRNTFIVKLSAAALADATELTVDALPYALKAGDVLESGDDEYITVTADVDAGATTVPIEALTTAMEDNDELIALQPGASVERFIPQGSVMARDATSGKLIDRSVATGGETATEFLVSDANENSKSDAKSGYGTIRGGGVYENLCPHAGTNGASAGDLPSAWKTELGARFWFTDWRDSRSE